MILYNAQVITPDGILPRGGVEISAGRIVRVMESRDSGGLDLESCYLVPGLVDIHTHPMREDASNPARLAELCDELRGRGTAAFLYAPSNVPVAELLGELRRLRSCIEGVGADRGCIGLHLEGPYVEEAGRGGFQPDAITTPGEFPLEDLLGACQPWARYINISPGLPGAAQAIRTCRRRGLAVSIGHTAASREALLGALEAGATAICHTFNASAIQRWKEPGVLDVTLDLLGLSAPQLVCELICDGVHVDPVLVRALYHAKGADGIALITDSVLGGRAARDGQEVAAGATRYRVEGGVGRLPGGGLAGSTLSMAQAVRNFVEFTGCGLVEAAAVGSATPARVLGIEEHYGAIAPGRRALFCVLDSALEVREDLCRRINVEYAARTTAQGAALRPAVSVEFRRKDHVPPSYKRRFARWTNEIFGEQEDKYLWAKPDWHLLVRHDGRPACHVAITKRTASVDGKAVALAGIGGLMTPPEWRRCGLATTAMRHAARFIDEKLCVDFGLLLCGEALAPFYERLDWRRIDAPVFFEQPGGTLRWDECAMVLPCREQDWPPGGVDLRGLPW